MIKGSLLKFKVSEVETFVFNGQTIHVKPYLSLEEQQSIMVNYVEEYFSQTSFVQTPFNLIGAEYGMMLNIIDVCTSIPVIVSEEAKEGDEEVKRPAFPLDKIFENFELWEQIISKIKNYKEFRKILDNVIKEIKDQKAQNLSVGYVIDNLYEKATSFFSTALTTKISDDEFNKVKLLMDEISKSPVLSGALKVLAPEADAKKNNTRKTTKRASKKNG